MAKLSRSIRLSNWKGASTQKVGPNARRQTLNNHHEIHQPSAKPPSRLASTACLAPHARQQATTTIESIPTASKSAKLPCIHCPTPHALTPPTKPPPQSPPPPPHPLLLRTAMANAPSAHTSCAPQRQVLTQTCLVISWPFVITLVVATTAHRQRMVVATTAHQHIMLVVATTQHIAPLSLTVGLLVGSSGNNTWPLLHRQSRHH